MSAKLNMSWRTKCLEKRHDNVTVFCVYEFEGRHYATVQLHSNCLGMTHDGCRIEQSRTLPGSFDTYELAERALAAFVATHRSRT